MISVKEAKEILNNNLHKNEVVAVRLKDALGFILAEDLMSLIDVPSFDNSAMDGYAFCFEEGLGQYKIVQQIQAGDEVKFHLNKGEAARIFTGAKLPFGADSVVEQEIVNRDGDLISFDTALSFRGKHVRKKGTQCQSNDIIVKKGSKVTTGMIGLLASVGLEQLKVYAAPKVNIITTGNEIIPLGNSLNEGQIYNSNELTLVACLKKLSINKVTCYSVNDNYEALKSLIENVLQQTDVLILTGGISVGDYDFVYQVLKEENVVELFYKVKQKPGKPLFVGKKESKWIFALPGNPASVLACFNQYVQPCLQAMMGYENAFQPHSFLPLNNDFEKKGTLTHFLKAKTENGGVTILSGQDSFNLLPFAEADSFVLMSEEIQAFKKGDTVPIYFL